MEFSLHIDLPRKYKAPIPLNKNKLNDLRELVDYLVPKYTRQKYWEPILGPLNTNNAIDEELDEPDNENENEPTSSRSFYDYTS